MVRGIVAYALTLVCGGAFYLFYPGYLSYYTLLLLLTLPLLSLLFTLLSRRRYTLVISADRSAVARGEEAFLRLSLQGVPGERVNFSCKLEGLLHSDIDKVYTFTLIAGQDQTLVLPTQHCGWLKLTPLRCSLPGWLGCVSVPLPLPEAVLVLVEPRPGVVPQGLELAPKAGARLQPRPGGGPGEEYELRPYRPGDPVNAIHWKLTAKQPGEEPILRETLEPVRERLAVTYDHFGSAEELDDVLDQLLSLTKYLLSQERFFTLCWSSPADRALTCYEVDCPKAWESCYRSIAARPAPPAGLGFSSDALVIPGWSGSVRRIHLTPHSEEVGKE